LAMSLDELAREGARRMLAAALEAEVDAYIAALAALVDEHGHRLVVRNGHAPARQLATGAGQVEVVRPGWTTAGWTPPPASATSSTARSCPDGPDAPRRSPRCWRCCTCTGSAPATSSPQWRSCSAPGRAGRPRWSPGSPPSGRPNARPSPSATCRRWTTGPAGPTASTSASAWASRVGCAAWSSWACAPTGEKSWSRWPTAPGSRPRTGPSCYGTFGAVAWGRRW
jgi:hypothetical protein